MCLLICYEIDSEGQGTASISSWQLRNETSKKKNLKNHTHLHFLFILYYAGLSKLQCILL